jgi:transposase-like protein
MSKIRRVRRSAAIWRELFSRHGSCGLTVTEFCRREGINAGLFRRWRSALDRSGVWTSHSLQVSFVKLVVAQRVIFYPADSVPRAQNRLIPSVSKLCSPEKLGHEDRTLLPELEYVERGQLATGDVGRSIGRQLARVNRHAQASILQ